MELHRLPIIDVLKMSRYILRILNTNLCLTFVEFYGYFYHNFQRNNDSSNDV